MNALTELDLGPGRVGSEALTESRALVKWMLSLLPEGGRGSVRQEPSADDDLRWLVDEVLAAGCGNGISDPLVWSRDNVRRLLDPERTFLAPAPRASTAHRSCSAT